MPQIYQYLPLIKPKASLRLIPKILKTGAYIIVDLEDGIQDTLNPENTPNLKVIAREGLRLLVDQGTEYFQTKKIGIRINAVNTPEYAFDIDAIANIASKIVWDAIWLPMVDSPEMIIRCRHDLARAGITETDIIPIVETVSAIRDLKTILKSKDRCNLRRIHYGHYDYSLDTGHWPFLRQNSREFWALAEGIIQDVETYECEYIHTPLGELDNEKLFLGVGYRLSQICKCPYGVTALSIRQTNLAEEKLIDYPLNDITELSDKERIKIARETIEAFVNYRCSKRSFSLNSNKGVFITPHEYKAACRYLKDSQTKN